MVKGLERLQRQLKAIPKTQYAAVRAALEEGAIEVRDAVRRAASGGGPALVNSIDYTQGQVLNSNGMLGTGSGGETGTAKADAGLLFTVHAGGGEAFYARWYEFGTAPHSLVKGSDVSSGKRQHGGGQWHPGAKPHPFFFPTVRALQRRVKSRVVRASGKAARAIGAAK